jgi:hypothetical protein
MQLDRSAFLVLVGTIAAAGCSSSTTNNYAGSGGSSGSSGSGGSAGSSTGGSSAGGGGSSGTGGGTGGTASGGTGGSKTDGGGPDAATDGSVAKTDGATSDGSADGATSCDDTLGTPAACTPLSASTCWDWASSLCSSSATLMKPKVGTKAVACMLALPDTTCGFGTDAGVPQDPYSCVADALAGACADAAANADCTKYVTDCSGSASMTEKECHAMLDGFTAEGRTTLATTMGSDCNSGLGLWSAIESL